MRDIDFLIEDCNTMIHELNQIAEKHKHDFVNHRAAKQISAQVEKLAQVAEDISKGYDGIAENLAQLRLRLEEYYEKV